MENFGYNNELKFLYSEKNIFGYFILIFASIVKIHISAKPFLIVCHFHKDTMPKSSLLVEVFSSKLFTRYPYSPRLILDAHWLVVLRIPAHI